LVRTENVVVVSTKVKDHLLIFAVPEFYSHQNDERPDCNANTYIVYYYKDGL